MDVSPQTDASGLPPKEFVERVKAALEHLYDFAWLQAQPLAQQMAVTIKRPSETMGHNLRRELMMAIEALSPAPNVSGQALDARLYNLLQLHYVENLTVQDVGQRMGLSTRQAHRSLRRAEEGVATILWSRIQQAAPETSRATQLSSVEKEIEQLETNLQPTNLRLLLAEARKAVAPLAQGRGVNVQEQAPDEPLIVSTDTAVSRQLFVSILSRIVQQSQAGPVHLTLTPTKEQVTVHFSYQTEASARETAMLDTVIHSLVSRLGWQIQSDAGTGRVRAIHLALPLHGPVVLVIDDNEGLVELLERYLTGHDCRVIVANSGQEGLDLAQRIPPDAVVLDAMMPGMSGWDVLQTLRARPETAETPIIICSVFNDPELAYALGASHFVSKPISRDNILAALRQLKVV